MKGVPVARLFVAIDPAPEVREALARAAARVRSLAPKARWVDVAGAHVTLAFLGDVAEGEIGNLTATLAAVGARQGPMSLRFTGARTFGGPRPRVLWVGLAGEIAGLSALHGDLVEALAPFGYEPEHDGLTPHLTLARAGDRAGDPGLFACAKALEGEDFGPTSVDAMVLYQSELTPRGARYTARARLAFSKGA